MAKEIAGHYQRVYGRNPDFTADTPPWSTQKILMKGVIYTIFYMYYYVGIPYGILILKFLNENPGSSKFDIRQVLGIESDAILNRIGLVNVPDTVSKQSTISKIGQMKRLELIKIFDENEEEESEEEKGFFQKFIGKMSSQITSENTPWVITTKGNDLLTAHGEKILDIIEFIKGRKNPSIFEVMDYYNKVIWKQKPFPYSVYVNAYKLQFREPVLKELYHANIIRIEGYSEVDPPKIDNNSRLSVITGSPDLPKNATEVIERIYNYLYSEGLGHTPTHVHD